VKAESGRSVEEPGKELGLAQPEARTCPVCGTKFFATADSEFCPVCILRGATSEESASTGQSDARRPGASQVDGANSISVARLASII